MDGPVHLGKNLFRRVLTLGPEIIKVGELVRHIDVRVFCRHLMGKVNAVANALADIILIVNENDFRAVLLHQLSPLLTDGVGHDDDHPVALHRAHKGQADALVAAGGFHDDGAFMDIAPLLCLFYHIKSSPGLDGAAHIQSLKLDQNLGIFRPGQTV